MNYEFWGRVKPGGKNPTLSSNLMTSLLTKQTSSSNPNKNDNILIKLYDREPAFNRSSSLVMKISNRSNHNPEPGQQLKQAKSSRISSFGSSSLSKLQDLNTDRDVYQKQRIGREKDIVFTNPKEYKDTIKVFPKLRFENFDQEYWRRKSFIYGLHQDAYNLYSPQTKTYNQKSE